MLRYSRSRVFTFLVFMPRILGNGSGKNNQSCSTFHQESNKIGFAFLWCFYDFLRYLQVSAKVKHYLRSGFQRSPRSLSSARRVWADDTRGAWAPTLLGAREASEGVRDLGKVRAPREGAGEARKPRWRTAEARCARACRRGRRRGAGAARRRLAEVVSLYPCLNA
jgi:hypothetical protein